MWRTWVFCSQIGMHLKVPGTPHPSSAEVCIYSVSLSGSTTLIARSAYLPWCANVQYNNLWQYPMAHLGRYADPKDIEPMTIHARKCQNRPIHLAFCTCGREKRNATQRPNPYLHPTNLHTHSCGKARAYTACLCSSSTFIHVNPWLQSLLHVITPLPIRYRYRYRNRSPIPHSAIKYSAVSFRIPQSAFRNQILRIRFIPHSAILNPQLNTPHSFHSAIRNPQSAIKYSAFVSFRIPKSAFRIRFTPQSAILNPQLNTPHSLHSAFPSFSISCARCPKIGLFMLIPVSVQNRISI